MTFAELDPGNFVIIYRNGVYKQHALAVFDDRLFAEIGRGSYVQLYKDNSTSNGGSIVHLETNRDFRPDKFGRLVRTRMYK